MVYKDGSWGEKAKLRSKKRLEYFKNYSKNHKQEYNRKNYKRKFNGFGSLGEIIGLKILLGSKLVRKSEFDIEWQDKKVEVKIATFNKYSTWYFHTGRQKGKTDYFLLICMEKNKKIINKMYFIPDNFIPDVGGINIYKNSEKYNKFTIESEVK